MSNSDDGNQFDFAGYRIIRDREHDTWVATHEKAPAWRLTEKTILGVTKSIIIMESKGFRPWKDDHDLIDNS